MPDQVRHDRGDARGQTLGLSSGKEGGLGFDLCPFDAAEHRSLHWVKQKFV